MENKNKIIEYVEDILYFKRHNDSHGMMALRKEGKDEHVTLEEVGFAFLEILEDLTTYVDPSQAAMELRLRAIVDCLDDNTALRASDVFAEAEDDLFENYESEENTDETENS